MYLLCTAIWIIGYSIWVLKLSFTSNFAQYLGIIDILALQPQSTGSTVVGKQYQTCQNCFSWVTMSRKAHIERSGAASIFLRMAKASCNYWWQIHLWDSHLRMQLWIVGPWLQSALPSSAGQHKLPVYVNWRCSRWCRATSISVPGFQRRPADYIALNMILGFLNTQVFLPNPEASLMFWLSTCFFFIRYCAWPLNFCSIKTAFGTPSGGARGCSWYAIQCISKFSLPCKYFP